MKYFVDMHDDKLHFIPSLGEEKCNEVLQSYNAVGEILFFHRMGQCVCDALDQLLEWSNKANPSGNYLLRNLHVADKLVRGFLFEFRTCLDYMEAHIKDEHGEDSEIWKIFDANTSIAYDSCPEYAFTYHLRNCAQHCRNVVHGFNGTSGIGISSNAGRLLREYKKWKPVDKEFLRNAGNEVDLLHTFSNAFQAFNTALRPVMVYLLNNNSIGGEVTFLRKWGDFFHNGYGHDVHCYHIVDIHFRDGKSATKEDMESGDVVINAYPIDWKVIYELSDSITATKKST